MQAWRDAAKDLKKSPIPPCHISSLFSSHSADDVVDFIPFWTELMYREWTHLYHRPPCLQRLKEEHKP